MCTYLAKRGSTYYFRRPIPKELLAAFHPRTEWMISLRTKDRETAKELLPALTQRTNREMRTACMQGADQSTEAPAPVRPRTAEEKAREDAERERLDAQEAHDLEQEAAEEAMAERADRHDAALDALLAAPSASLTSREWAIKRRLHDARSEAQIARDALAIARWHARQLEAKPGGTVGGDTVSGSGPSVVKPAISFTGMMEGYLAEAKRNRRMKPGSEISWRPRIVHFREFIGHDDAAQVTEDDVLKWLNKLETEPGPKGRMLLSATVKGYLSAVNATFKWGRKRAGLRANPAQDVEVMSPRRVKAGEKGFTDEQAVQVLTASLKPAPERMSREYALARRWLPWLCAYTGARVGEIAQMRAKDLQKIGERWVLLVTPEAGTVKNDQPRKVPLHSHIVEMGFPALVQTYRPDETLFYTLDRSPNADSERLYKKPAEKVGQMVRGLGIAKAEIDKPNHAWRDRFKDKARLHALDMEAADVIQGHTPPTVGRTYGGGNPVEWMAREIDKLPRYKVEGA